MHHLNIYSTKPMMDAERMTLSRKIPRQEGRSCGPRGISNGLHVPEMMMMMMTTNHKTPLPRSGSNSYTDTDVFLLERFYESRRKPLVDIYSVNSCTYNRDMAQEEREYTCTIHNRPNKRSFTQFFSSCTLQDKSTDSDNDEEMGGDVRRDCCHEK